MADIDQLLKPISEAQPSGSDMVFSSEFDVIQKARQEDDPNLEQGEWVTDLKEADWSLVVRTAESLLKEKTKDIRVAGWLLEGWMQVNGFEGYAKGLALLEGLCRDFWDTLYPQVEEGELQQRAGNLAWIINRSGDLLGRIPLTQADGARYGYVYWAAANQLAHAVRRSPSDEAYLTRDRVTLEDFDQARSRTPAEFYVQTYHALQQCKTNQLRLEEVLTEYLGDEAPGFSQSRQELENIESLVQRLARDSGADLGDGASEELNMAQSDAKVSEENVAGTIGPDTAFVSSQVQSRRQAIEQLRQIAAFFRETEPHSPVAYLADKAVQWANLPLHAWLKAVVKNPDALSSIEELLGVDQPDN